MRTQLGADLDVRGLAQKYDRMRESPFAFLRATYWRWAEGILDLLPAMAAAPQVLAIGDTHLENFGTWRDAEGRLIWGANDFDDAARMPWPLDLVRLAASALLARGKDGPRARAICAALATGYRQGLDSPRPVVIERDHAWLRSELLLSPRERAEFWAGLTRLRPAAAPPALDRALRAAMPEPGLTCQILRRTAGTGSLGRPRFVALADWQGGPVVREAKRLLPSAWCLCHRPEDPEIHAGRVAHGPARAVDPHYRVADGIVVRRLSPNSRKINLSRDPGPLLSPRMLDLMGREIAHCHAADPAALAAIRDDLDRRDPDWLRDAAKAAAAWVAGEQRVFALSAAPGD